MKKIIFNITCVIIVFVHLTSYSKEKTVEKVELISPAIKEAFGSNIDLNNLPNYENQKAPTYITKDNTNGNTISNSIVTLGRVLFYDKNLSYDNSIS